MNCTDFLAKLTDYFDGHIDPALLTEVKEHLGSCHHCEVVVDTTRKTIDVYRGTETYEFPEELGQPHEGCGDGSLPRNRAATRGREAGFETSWTVEFC